MTCEVVIKVNESSAFSVMYRLVAAGANLEQADVSSIQYAVYDAETEEELVALTSLTVADCVFDTLQLDGMWTRDNLGYNFKHDVPHTLFTNPSVKYRMEYKVTLTGGSQYFLTPMTIVVESIWSA